MIKTDQKVLNISKAILFQRRGWGGKIRYFASGAGPRRGKSVIQPDPGDPARTAIKFALFVPNHPLQKAL
jgi:hypothetical protein